MDQACASHFRDVRGTAAHFEETFHDNGPTDMARAIRRYHVPSMAGEEEMPHGYVTLGRLFAIGYKRGICDALAIPAR